METNSSSSLKINGKMSTLNYTNVIQYKQALNL